MVVVELVYMGREVMVVLVHLLVEVTPQVGQGLKDMQGLLEMERIQIQHL
jgi:hypothetical protein